MRYSNALSDVLAALLPMTMPGSISSVPGAWKLALHSEGERAVMAGHMLQHAAHLHMLRETCPCKQLTAFARRDNFKAKTVMQKSSLGL